MIQGLNEENSGGETTHVKVSDSVRLRFTRTFPLGYLISSASEISGIFSSVSALVMCGGALKRCPLSSG